MHRSPQRTQHLAGPGHAGFLAQGVFSQQALGRRVALLSVQTCDFAIDPPQFGLRVMGFVRELPEPQ